MGGQQDRDRRQTGPLQAARAALRLIGIGLLVAAVVRELRRPREERTWHGRLGGVPYDLRPPSPSRLREAWWNPEDDRVLTPRPFGVGWAVNLAEVRSRLTG